MKKITIYVDWENQEILSNEEEINDAKENIRQALEDDGEIDFREFLENNYSAFEIYEMSERDKIEVGTEFDEEAENMIDDRFDSTYEKIEIEVEE